MSYPIYHCLGIQDTLRFHLVGYNPTDMSSATCQTETVRDFGDMTFKAAGIEFVWEGSGR